MLFNTFKFNLLRIDNEDLKKEIKKLDKKN